MAAAAAEAESWRLLSSNSEPEGQSNSEPEGQSNSEPEGQSNSEPEGQSNSEPEGQSNSEPEGQSNSGPEGQQASRGRRQAQRRRSTPPCRSARRTCPCFVVPPEACPGGLGQRR